MFTATVPPPAPVAAIVSAAIVAVEVAPDAPVEVRRLPRISTAAALEHQAVADGYSAGFPPHLPDQVREIDAKSVRRMRCPACHSRGLECKPFHRIKPGLPYGYRIVASCATCGAGEVV